MPFVRNVAALCLALAAPFVQAQTWPAKPVKVVVGFAAGGPTDVVARAFAEYAARALGQPFVVDNRPGANTVLAAEAVASAPPDGYTLLFGATNHTMIPALYSARVRFDAVRSFAPVCTLAASPTVLVVGPALKVASVAKYIEAAKAEPGKRTFGSPGPGSSGHFAGERFSRMTKTSLNHIPYKGAAPAITDLIGGQIDSSFATLGSVLTHIQSGKLTALAVAAGQRSSLLPDTPTFDEAGVKDYRDDAWYGLLAPSQTPPPVLATLEKVAREFAQAPAAAEKLRALGMSAQSTCGAAFLAQVQREVQFNTQLAKDIDLKLE